MVVAIHLYALNRTVVNQGNDTMKSLLFHIFFRWSCNQLAVVGHKQIERRVVMVSGIQRVAQPRERNVQAAHGNQAISLVEERIGIGRQ